MDHHAVGLFTVMGSQSVHDGGTPVNIWIILSEVNDSTIMECVAFFPEQSPIKRAPLMATAGLLATHSINKLQFYTVLFT